LLNGGTEISVFIKNIFIFDLKMNESLIGLELYGGVIDERITHFGASLLQKI